MDFAILHYNYCWILDKNKSRPLTKGKYFFNNSSKIFVCDADARKRPFSYRFSMLKG
jgi:hypothetical protein